MLSYILGLISDYQRQHGRIPRLVYLNHRHVEQLKAEHPEIFTKDQWPSLGFRILIVSEYELPHPKVVWFPTIRIRRIPKLNYSKPKQPYIEGPVLNFGIRKWK